MIRSSSLFILKEMIYRGELVDSNIILNGPLMSQKGDHVVERGRGIQTFTANENSPMPSMKMVGDYLVFWKKYPNGWKILYDYVVVQTPEPQSAEE